MAISSPMAGMGYAAPAMPLRKHRLPARDSQRLRCAPALATALRYDGEYAIPNNLDSRALSARLRDPQPSRNDATGVSFVRSRRSTRRQIHLAFSEFLGLPVAIIVAFLGVAVATYALDRSTGPSAPLRDFMEEHFLGDPASTSELLATVAGSIITVTSITFSLLLIAVQQATNSFSHQVIDQFLRRRINQVSFGFFVGLALFSLVAVATASNESNPVYAAAFALVLTVVALVLLLFLLYTTIDQMRPEEIVGAIHDRVLAARKDQRHLLAITRRASVYGESANVARREVLAPIEGYLVAVGADRVGELAAKLGEGCEVEYLLPLGGYMSTGDPVARITASNEEHAKLLHDAVFNAIEPQRKRETQSDPGFGIEQLADIAWTTGSTSKQNPSPALIVVRNLRDLLARWSIPTDEPPPSPPLPVVYHDDVPEGLFSAFESIAVVASESMQGDVFAEVMDGVAMMFARLPAWEQARSEELVLRSLAALGDLVLTHRLESALGAVSGAMAAGGRHETAAAVAASLAELRQSVGKLNSRATRVPGTKQSD